MKITRAAQCRMFTPGKAALMAWEAHRVACLESEPPPGEPFVVDGVSWSDQSLWAFSFVNSMLQQVRELAESLGVPCTHGSALDAFNWEDFRTPENAPFAPQDNRLDNAHGERG